jgi:hypothetical protein
VTRRRGGMRSARRMVAAVAHHQAIPVDPPALPRDPYVRARIHLTLLDIDGAALAHVECVASIERDGWEALPPSGRRAILDDLAAKAEIDQVKAEWSIDDPDDFDAVLADTDSDQPEDQS